MFNQVFTVLDEETREEYNARVVKNAKEGKGIKGRERLNLKAYTYKVDEFDDKDLYHANEKRRNMMRKAYKAYMPKR